MINSAVITIVVSTVLLVALVCVLFYLEWRKVHMELKEVQEWLKSLMEKKEGKEPSELDSEYSEIQRLKIEKTKYPK